MNPVIWDSASVCLQTSSSKVESLAIEVYDLTCRTTFNRPGFCAFNLGSEISSTECRQWMVNLKQVMSDIHQERTSHTLEYLSAARFDQQETTKPHLDAGPDECFLMLGYEPSEVESELEIVDYSKCAYDLQLTPQELMAKHNPMYQSGYEVLRPYSTRIPCFSKTDFQIICINNSSALFSTSPPNWQGVLHTATILTPDESKRRVINSTMIASVESSSQEIVDAPQIQEFIHNSTVHRRGYDKQHLKDDL